MELIHPGGGRHGVPPRNRFDPFLVGVELCPLLQGLRAVENRSGLSAVSRLLSASAPVPYPYFWPGSAFGSKSGSSRLGMAI